MSGGILALRGGGVSLVIDVRDDVPRIVHFGADLGALSSQDLLAIADSAIPARLNATPDDPLRFSLLPTEDDGWTGRPGLVVVREGRQLNLRLRLESWAGDTRRAQFRLTDADVVVTVAVELDEHGVLLHGVHVRNVGAGPLVVERAESTIPLPSRAVEFMDFTGAWIGERAPQRRRLAFGTHAREQRRGRTGHDSSFVTIAGTAGFRNRSGEVWAMHVAWSGDQGSYIDRLADGAGALSIALSGGELIRRGEATLPPGGEYAAPDVLFTWSDSGLDGLTARFHAHVRSRDQHPRSARPLTLNTWEAVYFNHDLPTLLALAERAAEAGVERFVLDDGWFHGRNDDTSGLGDWWVDEKRWPAGLHPLVRRVRELGMQFGLWVEPEMVNLDSDLARSHPDWLLTPADGWAARSQHVIDVARQEVAEHLLGRMDALVEEYAIDFLKWDHNRDILEAASHAQTTAVYRLIDDLRARHPGLEIETCASGGGRVDLGILARTDRVWPSDTIDPFERQAIQRWTSLLLPPELIGAHVGAARAHTTARTSELGFRLATALFWHAGFELDLSHESERPALQRFGALYRRLRPLTHSGVLVHGDLDDPSVTLTGIVGDGHAVFSWVQLAGTAAQQQGRVLIPGLEAGGAYDIRVLDDLDSMNMGMSTAPPWFTAARQASVRMPADALTRLGLPMPPMLPGSVALLELTRAE